MRSQSKKWKTIRCSSCGEDSRVPASSTGNPSGIGKRTLMEVGWRGSSKGFVCGTCANRAK